MGQLFVVEYCNTRKQAFHETVSTVIEEKVDDKQLQEKVISDLALDGFRVFALWEILDGYTFKEHERLYETNPSEGKRTMRMIFYDPILAQIVD